MDEYIDCGNPGKNFRKGYGGIRPKPPIRMKFQDCVPEWQRGLRTKFGLADAPLAPVRAKRMAGAPVFQTAAAGERLKLERRTWARGKLLTQAPRMCQQHLQIGGQKTKNGRGVTIETVFEALAGITSLPDFIRRRSNWRSKRSSLQVS